MFKFHATTETSAGGCGASFSRPPAEVSVENSNNVSAVYFCVFSDHRGAPY
ncbi:MAG: hypothetical protein ACKVHQ_04890 [Gammaproteobacteria bacterium]